MTFLAYAVVPLVDKLTLHWFVRDLDMRSKLITSTLQEPLGDLLEQGNSKKINSLIATGSLRTNDSLPWDYCDGQGKLLYQYTDISRRPGMFFAQFIRTRIACTAPTAPGTGSCRRQTSSLSRVYRRDLSVLVHDMSFVERRSADTRKYIVILFVVLCLVTSLITVLVAHLSWRGWMTGVRAMLRGEGLTKPFSKASNSELQPLVGDLRALLRTIDAERRFADDVTISWNPDALRNLLHKQLAGEQILVVSNREPYIHMKGKEGIEINRPASGLVTAVEPVMRACSGTWIAHGGGTADREVVDKNDHVSIPPEHPEYTLRRIWLTKEEEKGYYYGFANEGLWPLCHIAHVRPIFRTSDWEHYVAINQRFADAVVKEADREDPVVLVQDYHFALLPGMIRKALPKATIITFWHIPWPNPESFGICPWREELLQGMLGSTILGFHTPFHCKNFLETVDRYLETRIEHASSTISHGGNLTLVEAYPISIQWPPPWQDSQPSVADCRAEIRRSLKIDEIV